MDLSKLSVEQSLTVAGANASVKGFMGKISAFLRDKRLTLPKLVSIFLILDKAVKEIEAVLASK